jgi:DNA cross-link repair 1A protein
MFGPPELFSCDGKRPNSGKSAGGNAFSVLMSSFKENEVWREASVAEGKSNFPWKFNGGRRKAPFYKVLQGMPVAVDAFRYGAIPGVTAYFLTSVPHSSCPVSLIIDFPLNRHAHSDHYTNLSFTWKHGPIYCSQGTANLIVHMLSVDRKWVHPLPMDIPTLIPNSGGVTVTLIEANHCPGSCLFFFEGPQTVNAGDSTFKSSFVGSLKTFRYLHCGDFRASPRHIHHPSVKGKTIDHVYLDTTYLDPKVSSRCLSTFSKIRMTHSIHFLHNHW